MECLNLDEIVNTHSRRDTVTRKFIGDHEIQSSDSLLNQNNIFLSS